MASCRCSLALSLLVLFVLFMVDEVLDVLVGGAGIDQIDVRLWWRDLRLFCQDLCQLRPLVLEPFGLHSRLRAATPPRRLSAEELRTFETNGVVTVRGIVRDEKLLRDLVPSLAVHQQMISGALYTKPWEYNGAALAFLRQEPLRALCEEALPLEGRLMLLEAPIWGHLGINASFGISNWHMDQSRDDWQTDMVTLWLAVTHAPHAIEFLRGSHRRHLEIAPACNRSQRGQPLSYDSDCALRFGMQDGRGPVYWDDLNPGDGFLFHGNTAHRTVKWIKGRTALSMRFSKCTETRLCHPEIVFGHNDHQLSHFGGRILPRPAALWPELIDILPGGPEWPWTGWLLRGLVAAATQTFPTVDDAD